MNDPIYPTEFSVERAAIVRDAGTLMGVESMARDIGVSGRAVHRWISRQRGVDDDKLDAIHTAVDRRLTALDAVARRIRAELASK